MRTTASDLFGHLSGGVRSGQLGVPRIAHFLDELLHRRRRFSGELRNDDRYREVDDHADGAESSFGYVEESGAVAVDLDGPQLVGQG